MRYVKTKQYEGDVYKLYANTMEELKSLDGVSLFQLTEIQRNWKHSEAYL